ncbi:MAG: HprK-related kinase A [Sphingomonadales bacterium]
MAQVRSLDRRAIARQLARGDLVLPVGPYAMALRAQVPAFAQDFVSIYGPYQPRSATDAVADFGIDVAYTAAWRRFYRPSVAAYCDIASPFVPMPGDIAFVGAEMAANWQIAMGAGNHLLIHGAAVADSADRAVIMPGSSGSGKSTLAAMLAFAGWRLLADEFVMLDLATGMVAPYPRPVSLKNQAIDAMRAFAATARISRPFLGTVKGTIAYLTPPDDALAAMARPARPAMVVFPQFKAGLGVAETEALDGGELLMRLIAASANYSRLGAEAFERATDVAADAPAFRLRFGDGRQGVDAVARLAALHMSGAGHG